MRDNQEHHDDNEAEILNQVLTVDENTTLRQARETTSLITLSFLNHNSSDEETSNNNDNNCLQI